MNAEYAAGTAGSCDSVCSSVSVVWSVVASAVWSLTLGSLRPRRVRRAKRKSPLR